MDLSDQTLHALDWAAVRTALSELARTPMGRAAAASLRPLSTLDAVHAALDATGEILLLEQDGAWVPVGEVPDASAAITRAQRGGTLDDDELRTSGRALDGMRRLAGYLLEAEADIVVLRELAPSLQTDDTICDALLNAYDDTGRLSARAYPVLGSLRERIQNLHGSIRRTLDELVGGDAWGDILQDRFVTQRGDRYVVPVKANFKRKELGIVHGMSGSGQTAFIEPREVVALNNDLRMAEGELEAAEKRIRAQLSSQLGRVAVRALAGLEVVTTVDLAAARAGLAIKLEATRPVVREDGVLRLARARHPVLALRGLDVVANDIALTPQQPILVISGPNTGGKTIALKTAGLAALMASSGCYVPAAEGSRVDRFDQISALIGDHQTVHGDHSSFSSHLEIIAQMLAQARIGSLFLIDEIASGTDPQQGASLAHAVLERLQDTGARAVVTTHFHRLKTVSALDPRFAIAGMQFSDGRPTYQLIAGASGESHALSIAERIGLDPDLLERARELMGEGERTLADTLAALDLERSRAETASRRAEQLTVELETERSRLEAERARLKAHARQLEEERAAGFVDRLDKAEKAVAAVVAGLQAAPSHTGVSAAKATLGSLRRLAPQAEGRPKRAPQPEAPVRIGVGDLVKLRRLGRKGEVISVDGDRLEVQAGTLTVRAKTSEVERIVRAPKPALAPKPVRQPDPVPTTPLDQAVRHPGNTVDLRGLRVDEGLDEVERFLDRAVQGSVGVIFVLHGHGTGAMKKAVRTWLRTCPYIKGSTPAHAEQGGDAYTVAALR